MIDKDMFLDAFGEIDDSYVTNSEKHSSNTKNGKYDWILLAASLIIIVGISVYGLIKNGQPGGKQPMATAVAIESHESTLEKTTVSETTVAVLEQTIDSSTPEDNCEQGYIAALDMTYDINKIINGDTYLISSPIFDMQLIDIWTDEKNFNIYVRTINKTTPEEKNSIELSYQCICAYINGIEVLSMISENYNDILAPGEQDTFRYEIPLWVLKKQFGTGFSVESLGLDVRIVNNSDYVQESEKELISKLVSLPVDELNVV